ncbi:amidase [Shouchella tritolerans]|uniref:amidase n=1 Tax=Shouchella tritolerans TaxID=2979466 RepID=UPI0021E73510|nr:amidase [Shouchella tritolerans]
MNWNAFIDKDVKRKGAKAGILAGKTFAVKDVFAVKGHTNSAGNPDWLKTAQQATSDSPSIARLLAAGADLHGMAVTDELMYSLNGKNVHYGTPVNPYGADCVPGGSSSGSAVAVAAELTDFAIGTDTGGSIRIPSSYCGIYGFRPSHGVVDISGVIPLAESFDTVGWMARDVGLLKDIGTVLLGNQAVEKEVDEQLLIDETLVCIAEPDVQALVLQAADRLGAKQISRWTPDRIDEGFETFRHLQAREIWREHGEWVQAANPAFAADIGARFQWASTLPQQELPLYKDKQTAMKRAFAANFAPNEIVLLPTAAGPAPQIGGSGQELEAIRAQTMKLTSIAGLAGCPQITIPFASVEGLPIGLSAIGYPGQDLFLLSWANRLFGINT